MRIGAALALLCIITAIVVLFALPLIRQSDQADEKEMQQLARIIDKALVQCYALEGSYPPSIAYLKEHYGLSFSDKYIITYDTRGISNLKPDVGIMVNRWSGP